MVTLICGDSETHWYDCYIIRKLRVVNYICIKWPTNRFGAMIEPVLDKMFRGNIRIKQSSLFGYLLDAKYFFTENWTRVAILMFWSWSTEDSSTEREGCANRSAKWWPMGNEALGAVLNMMPVRRCCRLDNERPVAGRATPESSDTPNTFPCTLPSAISYFS